MHSIRMRNWTRRRSSRAVPANAGDPYAVPSILRAVLKGLLNRCAIVSDHRGYGSCVRRDDARGIVFSNNTASRSRGWIHPRFASIAALEKKRAQGKPGARCTRGLVCKLHEKKRTRAYRSSGGIRLSLRNGLRLIRDLPGDRAFLPPSSARLSTNLTPASGCQNHTTSPSA